MTGVQIDWPPAYSPPIELLMYIALLHSGMLFCDDFAEHYGCTLREAEEAHDALFAWGLLDQHAAKQRMDIGLSAYYVKSPDQWRTS